MSDLINTARTARTPIIVIGMNRSGTKWLSNILCNHAHVAGVQTERHNGIVESNMLSVLPQKFDLSRTDDYVACIELWSRGDFFQSTSVDRRIFLRKPWARDCHSLFIRLMEEHASQQDNPFWIQKASPEAALELLPRLPSARVVVIQRDFIETIKSALQLTHNDGHIPSILESVYSYAAEKKRLPEVLKFPNVMRVEYSDLRDNTADVVERVCEHIGLPFEPEMVEPRYTRNTSFDTKKHPTVEYVARHPTRVNWLRFAFGLLPIWVMNCYRRLKAAFTGHRSDSLIFGSYSQLASEMDDEYERSGSVVNLAKEVVGVQDEIAS